MTENFKDLKSWIGNHTQQLENYLEPYQRGVLVLVLITLLLVSIYLLTKKKNSPTQRTNWPRMEAIRSHGGGKIA